MTEHQQETEEQIFEAACRVFQRKGYHGARMQEIADEANINKSMLHYYYRSKDKLFQQVFQKEMSRFFPVIFGVFNSSDPLDEKVEQLIDAYYDFLSDQPYLPQFVLMEMNQHPERFRQFIEQKAIHAPERLLQQIEEEIAQGRLDPVPPRQLMISILGLILFPFIANTMIKTVLGLDDSDFRTLLKERKGMLKDFILNAINYRNP